MPVSEHDTFIALPPLFFAALFQLGGFIERCEARFNCACALALCGREEDARALLGQLVACGGITADELGADADLGCVRDRPWFQELLAAAKTVR